MDGVRRPERTTGRKRTDVSGRGEYSRHYNDPPRLLQSHNHGGIGVCVCVCLWRCATQWSPNDRRATTSLFCFKCEILMVVAQNRLKACLQRTDNKIKVIQQ